MLPWLVSNLSTILILVALLAIVVAIIWSMRKEKKSGKSACGGDCAHCGVGGSCHKV